MSICAQYAVIRLAVKQVRNTSN